MNYIRAIIIIGLAAISVIEGFWEIDSIVEVKTGVMDWFQVKVIVCIYVADFRLPACAFLLVNAITEPLAESPRYCWALYWCGRVSSHWFVFGPWCLSLLFLSCVGTYKRLEWRYCF